MDTETIKNFLNKKNKIGFVGATINKEKWGYRKYKEIKEQIKKMEEIEEKLAQKPEDNKDLLNRYNELQQIVLNSDYYIRDKQIEKILEQDSKSD